MLCLRNMCTFYKLNPESTKLIKYLRIIMKFLPPKNGKNDLFIHEIKNIIGRKIDRKIKNFLRLLKILKKN